MIVYRQMKIEDIPQCMYLCRYAGWNQLSHDWEIFLSHSPAGCMVATVNNQVVGSATTISYESLFSWIGMVLVHPDYRHRGIGKQLLQDALDILSGVPTVKLDATPEGRQLYLKMDFKDEYPISRMLIKKHAEMQDSHETEKIILEDLSTLFDFDQNIFGTSRQTLLTDLWKNTPTLAHIIKKNNQVLGYCMGRQGHNYMHIGPLVAEEITVAKELLSAALNQCAGSPAIIDTTHFNPDWVNWLTAGGFVEQRTFIRMYQGINSFPGIAEKIFGITGPEFG